MNKLSALWNLFRKGEQVANPGAWKDAQNYGFVIGGFLLAMLNVAEAFGYRFVLSAEDANSVGLGLATLFAFVAGNVSSEKAGILPAKPAPAALPGAQQPYRAEQPVLQPVITPVIRIDAVSIDDATRQRAVDAVRKAIRGATAP